MADSTNAKHPISNPFTDMFSAMLSMPGTQMVEEAAQHWLTGTLFNPALNPVMNAASMLAGPAASAPTGNAALPLADPDDAAHWAEITARLQTMWLDFQSEQAGKLGVLPMLPGLPAGWQQMVESWMRHMPLAQSQVQQKLWADTLSLWDGIAAQVGNQSGNEPPVLPRADRRFADPRWREQPYFALVHQAYLLLAEQITAMAEAVDGLDPARKEQLRFVTRTMVEAMSPDHFPMTNPLVIEKALETRGDSLVKGFEHLLGDLRKGQLTHTDTGAFCVGENIAVTPGKVVHRSRLFEIIQYTPSTENVLETPLVIFPPWINRFYILDLNPKKSFVKWAVDQGISTFMVSWKSADASMADVTWDDYIAAQIEAIDVVRERLKVPSVHTIGYCVAGTTLAATLAILARKGEAAKVASATFFTAQVDFEKAGDLRNFIDDQQLAALAALAPDGFLDGRYLAATFNVLRGTDLIWNYVTNNYLLGQDYPAFDLLYWNGDTTNLPAKWHLEYLRDLYRDNRLVQADSLSALGTPIDLAQITTPCYIQAGREDHIAPAESVWRLTSHLPHARATFVLAGSGHIAGVVNPPSSGKYQYWTNETPHETLEGFVAGATETPGSWWPHWRGWLGGIDSAQVPAGGRRVPGGRGDKVLAEAPGDFVRER
ncbi:MAG TPA: alpha/beta fold hydrolase [Novosphingobium sp.]|nr:alpha/beta fold hydrolase [Novosphingobium sp.]